MKKPNCFDIEVFPNFFSVSFKTLNEEERSVFVIFYDIHGNRHINNLVLLYKYLNVAGTCISYNGDDYDNMILTFLVHNKERFLKLFFLLRGKYPLNNDQG